MPRNPLSAIGKFLGGSVPALGTSLIGETLKNTGRSLKLLSKPFGVKSYNRTFTTPEGKTEYIFDKNLPEHKAKPVFGVVQRSNGEWYGPDKYDELPGLRRFGAKLGNLGEKLDRTGSALNATAGNMVGIGERGRGAIEKAVQFGGVTLPMAGAGLQLADMGINKGDAEATGFIGTPVRFLNNTLQTINNNPVSQAATEVAFAPWNAHLGWGPGMYLANMGAEGVVNGVNNFMDMATQRTIREAYKSALQTLYGVDNNVRGLPVMGDQISNQITERGSREIAQRVMSRAREEASRAATSRGMVPGTDEWNKFVDTYIRKATTLQR